MNIAVFGWYHHRNAGDDRIQQCITRWLDGHTLAFLPAGRRPPVHLLRTYDAAILGGGGLLRREGGMFLDMARWVRQAGIPVALVGVSVEGITPRLRQELREFLDVCCFAWFRDRGSLETVGDHPRAFVAPDVTWLYPFEPAEGEGRGLAVSVAPGTLQPRSAWRDALSTLGEPLHSWPLYFENGGDAAGLRELMPGRPIPSEFDLGPARQAAAVLTGRFHGLLFALQLGRPALAASDAPKVRRFLEENGLQGWSVAEPGSLGRVTGTREEALRLRSRLHDEVWEKATPARERLLDAASRLPPPQRRLGNRLRSLLDLGSWF
ncbi:MAG TPA: polysaccharide pyruvyl transferase family protein [Thermoanaerobaculia bacterium]|nr:polysaccharide pyruvyl transferase family protein [Thermoanaerobaculia bacterium]